ncbi:MAG: hypothetical protein WC998_08740 [Candidatus Paceibacterota bacterium]
MKDSCWTKCWKCTNKIPTQKDCYYMRTRDGNYYFCETCYKGFCSVADEYIQKDKTDYNETLRTINKAIREWHDNHHEETEICETCERIYALLREKLYPKDPKE